MTSKGADWRSWIVAQPIAHRGLHDLKSGIVENSMAAFKAARDSGFAMECDVQISRNGEAMVFHDFTLDRLTSEKGEVKSRTTAELQKLRLKGSAAQNTIQPLSDLIAEIAGRTPIVVEIKSAFDGDLALTKRVVEILRDAPANIAVKSFDPVIVAALRMIMPDRPRGIVAMATYDYPDYARLSPEQKHAMAHVLHYNETLPDFLSWHVKALDHAVPKLCRDGLNIPVMTWTVRTREDRVQAALKADQMVFEGFVP
jgi:glycerophosphoryl diester phosphodiesterase